ncbi:MAG: mechanosensitive ion channel family protein, partial [Planctomycetota bacterium]
MRSIARLAITLLVLLAALSTSSTRLPAQEQPSGEGAAGAGEQAPAPEEAPKTGLGPDRSSPRRLFQTFIEAYNAASRKDRLRSYGEVLDEGEIQNLRIAIPCLEPYRAGVPEGEELLGAYRQVRDLADVINYHGFIDYAELPGATEAAGASWKLTTLGGDIVLRRVDGAWLFSTETVTAAPSMIALFKILGASRYRAFSLRDYMPGMLLGRALILEHWQWIGLVVLLLLAWFVHRIVTFASRRLIQSVVRRRSGLERTAEALGLASGALGLFAAAAVIAVIGGSLELPAKGLRGLQVLAKILASFGGMLLCYRFADLAGARLEDAAGRTESRLDDQLAPMVSKSLKVLITLGAVLFVLDNLEVDVFSLLAGLGVLGVGISFAARDTFANLFGSLTVFTDKPFRIGDWVLIGDVEGTVEEIGFRSTRVRTFYNSLVSVPNSKLVDSSIDNMGARRYRRFKTLLGIRYDTPAEKIEAFCRGIRRVVEASPEMRQDYYLVHLNDFGASSLDILVYVFFQVPDWGAELRARQNFMLEVIRLAEAL